MSRMIYTGKSTALSFNSQVLTFNGDILVFHYKGLDYFEIRGFEFTETDMDESSITCDLYLPQETDPCFSLDWYIEFRGEKYYNKTLKPPSVKDADSVYYKYSLTFESERAKLKNYQFSNIVSYNGYAQPLSYDFSLPLTAAEFIERFNLNLAYNFGDSWIMVAGDEFVDTDRETIEFSRASLWDVLTGVYDNFGMRWTITSIDGVMTITLAPAVTTIDHVFKYGYDNGLVDIERINPLDDIYTRLSGSGSSRNLPYRYFDTATGDYIGDPDRNTLTTGIPYTNLMPISYRHYVQGWNAGVADPSLSDAYNAGVTDVTNGNNFTPWDFCVSTGSELKWGIKKGSLEANEDIYPTIQDVSSETLGRFDEVIAVEEILNDDYEDADASTGYESISSVKVSLVGAYDVSTSRSSDSSIFTYAESTNKVSFSGSLSLRSLNDDSTYSDLVPEDTTNCSVDVVVNLMSGTSIIDSLSLGQVSEFNGEFENEPAGDYFLRLQVTINWTNNVRKVFADSEINTIKVCDGDQVNEYKETFDIWIKNIWDSSINDDETESEFMHRVWDPLVTSEEMTVMFSTGLLVNDDYEFIIAQDGDDYLITHDESKSYGGVSSFWKLTLIKSDADLETIDKYLPYIGFNASAGDHFYLINIEMPYYPYVYDAEQRVEDYIKEELAEVDDEYPTFAITPSSEFIESGVVNPDDIKAGNKITIENERILDSPQMTFYILSVVLTYDEDKLLPVWKTTISDKPTSTTNSISLLQSSVDELTSYLSSLKNIDRLLSSFDELYLRRDGIDATSFSKTKFNKQVTVASGLVSDDFRQGGFAGSGMGLYKDANGQSTFEVDNIKVRRSLEVNELIVNQVTIYGGKHMYSAAAMTVSNVENISGGYRCYFDTKEGTVLNQFASDDQAYCQRYDPENNSVIKYYWRLVSGVGEDYIDLSTTDYDGDGIPAVGDNIAQLGNRTNEDRQAAYIINQLDGGSCTQYAKIDAFSFVDKDWISQGYDPSTGRAYKVTYGDSYVGARDKSTYTQWDSSTHQLTVKGVIVKTETGGEFPIPAYQGAYDETGVTVYHKGDWVTYAGASWLHIAESSESVTPVEGSVWTIYAANGTKGSDGEGVEFIFTRNNTGTTPDAPVAGEDDALPDDWTDDPQGVTSTLQYEFVSKRVSADDVWEAYGTPSLWTQYVSSGEDAISVEVQNPDIIATTVSGTVSTSLYSEIKVMKGGVFISYGSGTNQWSMTLGAGFGTATGISTPSSYVGTNYFKVYWDGVSFDSNITTTGTYALSVYVHLSSGDVTIYKTLTISRNDQFSQIPKGTWTDNTYYTGNVYQRDVVKYGSVYYIAKITANKFYSTTAPLYDSTHWSAMDSFQNIATGTLLADNANIANFIYKNSLMISQEGTIDGEDSSNYSDDDFVPNLSLNGVTGEISALKGTLGALTMDTDGYISLPPSWSSTETGKLNNSGLFLTYGSAGFQTIEWENVADGYAANIYVSGTDKSFNIDASSKINIGCSSAGGDEINIGAEGTTGDIAIGNSKRSTTIRGGLTIGGRLIGSGTIPAIVSGVLYASNKSTAIITSANTITKILQGTSSSSVTPSDYEKITIINTTTSDLTVYTYAHTTSSNIKMQNNQDNYKIYKSSSCTLTYYGSYWYLPADNGQ